MNGRSVMMEHLYFSPVFISWSSTVESFFQCTEAAKSIDPHNCSNLFPQTLINKCYTDIGGVKIASFKFYTFNFDFVICAWLLHILVP